MRIYQRNYSDLKSCLEDIFCNEGMECLKNGSKLVAMLTDLIPQNRGEITIIKRMEEHGILMEFWNACVQKNGNLDRVAYAAVEKLVNWELIDQHRAKACVQAFCQVLRQNQKTSWEANVLQVTDAQYFHRLAPKQAILGEPALPDRKAIATVTFLDTLDEAPVERYDVSQEKNGRVWAWATRNTYYTATVQPGTELFDLYIAADGGINGELCCNRLFYQCFELRTVRLNGCFHTENATRLRMMFSGCMNLRDVDLTGLNTSKVTTMEAMFGGCRCLTALDLSGFQTENVAIMNSMFGNCSELRTLNLSGFDISNVTDFRGMFRGCREDLQTGRPDIWEAAKRAD